MPKDILTEEVQLGTPAFQWMVKEYTRHERNRQWYLVMGGIALGLVGYAALSANYLFAVIIILFAMILYLQELREPLDIPFAITDTGVIVGRRWYPYSELKDFWIIYNPPTVKNLYISPSRLLRHRISIPLHDFDPVPIKEFLGQFLQENLEQEEEPFGDRIGRLFLLH